MKLESLDEGFFRLFSPNGVCFEIKAHKSGEDEAFLRIRAKSARTKKWEITHSFTHDEFVHMLDNRKGF